MSPTAKANQLKDKKYRCTACNQYIKNTFNAQLHPLLDCLVCRTCYNSYGNGDFTAFEEPDGVDEHGDDNYCRWCVDGGDLFVCGGGNDQNEKDRCHFAFCADCVKRNCPDDEVLRPDEIPAEDRGDFKWKCFACEPTKLKKLRQEAREILAALNKKELFNKSAVSSTNEEASTTTTRSGSSSNNASATTTSTSSKTVTLEVPTSASKRRRLDHSYSTETSHQREPESSKLPHLEIPKPPVSSLRRLAPKSSTSLPGQKASSTPTTGNSESRGGSIPKPSTPTTYPKTQQQSSSNGGKSIPQQSSSANSSKPSEPLHSSASKSNTSGTTPKQAQPGSSASKSSSTATSTSKSSAAATHSQKPVPLPIPLPTPRASTGQAQSGSTPFADLLAKNKLIAEESAKSLPKYGMQKSKTLTKQLKAGGEPINPTTKLVLSDHDLKKRLEIIGQVKNNCTKEIDIKFQNVIDMFSAKEIENKTILKYEIEDLEKPLQEFNTMLRDLKSLFHSQT